MKGKIDKDGFLHIERAGVMKQMRCLNNPDTFCSDSCPSFGDVWTNNDVQEMWELHNGFVSGDHDWFDPHIKICTGKIVYNSLTDERGDK